MKAVIYARYSSERQTEQSIEGQIRECKEFAEAEGITIIDSYIDRAISGKTDNRPAFQQMIADSASHKFNAIIVYKLDRFARNRYDSAMYKSKLKKNGVRVLSAKEHITDSPEGIIMEGLLEAMNEYYSAELSQKIRRGMRENVAKGKTTGGGVALGYKIGADKRLKIDTDTAPIVQKIFDMYSTGSSFAAIITALNDAGYKTSRGNDYNKCSIQRILKNRKYIGEYIVKNISEVSECPAIISKEQFEAVQVRLSEASHKRKHRNEHSYFLTGKLRCAVCGKPVTGTSGTSKTGKRYFYYKCANLCTSITQDKLENIVLNLLVDYLTPEKIYQISKAAYECYKREQANNTEQEALKNQISIIEKKINNIINAIMNGTASNSLQTALKGLEEDKERMELELERISIKMPELAREHFAYFLETIDT
ncbi:MAG: recombinase family protein, partial [Ruminococcus sp.]